MPRTTDKQRKKIIADYVETGNINKTAKMNGVSWPTVKHVIDTDKSTLMKFDQKKRENTQSVLEYMDSLAEMKKELAYDLIAAMGKKAKNPDMFTNIKDLATAYGIIADKEIKYTEMRASKETTVEDLSTLAGMLNDDKDDDNSVETVQPEA